MRVPERVLVIGLGSVSRCALPLFFRHVPLDPKRYTVVDFLDQDYDECWVKEQGAQFLHQRLTQDNYARVLAEHVGPGDLVVDLAWNLETEALLDWCHMHGVRYVNASVELWDPYTDSDTKPPTQRTLYIRQMALRSMIARWGGNSGPTAVLDHGANPGLVSHFVKAALDDIADLWLAERAPPGRQRDHVAEARRIGTYNRLAQLLDVKVIHISERDSQISVEPKQQNEFVNTWSVEGFYEEAIAPAEMGWGTHERCLPPRAHTHKTGPCNQICMAHPGCRTWVRSWVPSGEIVGMVLGHGEAFSISEHLTVEQGGGVVYRPTVHYAYCPADAAIASLHELHMRGYQLQPRQRIMKDDIVAGRDELGCLLMGHAFDSWWIGSLLDIHEARDLVPRQNATTVQVAAGVLGAVQYTIDHPEHGVCLPDDLPYRFVLEHARPYLGPFVSGVVDWTPMKNVVDLFAGYGRTCHAEDIWQFTTFLVDGPM